ncbi:MAG: RluA family pseudouridine synthase [Chloroflexota bacterium]
MGDRQECFIYADDDSARLDVFLVERLAEFSRARLQGLIRAGLVKVDGEVDLKTGRKLERGARVEVRIPPPIPSTLVGEDIPLEIIHEDDNLIVINKPAGMVVHPSPGHYSGTLVHAVIGHVPDLKGIGGEERPGVVHRLDKETSGLIVIAKNESSHRWLQDQFKSRSVEKTYLALVDGSPPTPIGRVEAPIGRNSSHRKLMAVVPEGKGREAVTEYRTLELFGEHALLQVHPLTGRTHQIRVHMAFLGCPVAGDRVYGKRKSTVEISRHFLHAARLQITLPGEDHPKNFEAPLPEDLQFVLDQLRNP